MSSLKMTFSLTSLILIIALGLVFVPTSVMAENPTTGVTARTHTHPLNEELGDDPNTPATEATIAAHNGHPMVTSITLKGDNTRGSEAMVSGTTVGTTDVFTLVITFDRALTAAGADRAIDSTAASPLTGAEFNALILNKDKITAATDGTTPAVVTIADSTRVADSKGTKFEAVATISGSFPSGAATDAHEVMYVKVSIDAAAGFSLASVPEAELVNGGASLKSRGYEFKLVKEFGTDTTKAVAVELTAPDINLDDPFTVTVSSMKMNADGEVTGEEIKFVEGTTMLSQHFSIDGAYAIDASLAPKPVNPPRVENSIWQFTVHPRPSTQQVSVEIKAGSDIIKAVEVDDVKVKYKVTKSDFVLNSIVAEEGADDEAKFDVTITFAAELPVGTDLLASHLALTPKDDPATTAVTEKAARIVDGPEPDGLNRAVWLVEIQPVKGMATTLDLSDAGKAIFSTASDYKMLTVKTKAGQTADATAASTITAAYAADTMTTTISKGMIAANKFAVIDYSDLPDLEYFFDIGGTITLHDADTADDENSRTVVISEILWGLDLGEELLSDQEKHQFIELYNTTATDISLKDWKLVFTRGNVVPASDIDQVSNRDRNGWEVDTGATGKSGRVANTTADDQADDAVITPARIVSMYRNINYDHVETQAAKDTVDRAELVKGIPSGNVIGSWKNSELRSTNRWIYSTLNAKHIKRVAILVKSNPESTPFRINEIGNDVSGDNDWIELHKRFGYRTVAEKLCVVSGDRERHRYGDV